MVLLYFGIFGGLRDFGAFEVFSFCFGGFGWVSYLGILGGFLILGILGNFLVFGF